MLKKLDLYGYSVQVYTEIFTKLNVCIFFVKNEIFLEKYNEIWKKVSNIIKREFNSKPVHNKKYLKTGKKINTKEGFQCTQVTLIDSLYRKYEIYCPKVFLEKYDDNMKIYSHYSYNVDSGEEHSDDSDDSDEVNSHEKIQTKNIEYIYIF